MNKNIGKQVQTSFYLKKSLNSNENRFHAERMERGSEKYNDISEFDNNDKRLNEYQIKSSTSEEVTTTKICDAASQVLASTILNNDLRDIEKCTIAITDSKMSDLKIKEYLLDSFEMIKKKAESFISKKIKDFESFISLDNLNELIGKLEIVRLKNDLKQWGVLWHSEYKNDIKSEFSNEFAPIWNKVRVDEVFEELHDSISSGLNEKIWMNKNVLGNIIVSKKVFGTSQIKNLVEWITFSKALLEKEKKHLINHINSGFYEYNQRDYKKITIELENSDEYIELETLEDKKKYIEKIIRTKKSSLDEEELILLSLWGVNNAN